jgi:proline iminopeptidase
MPRSENLLRSELFGEIQPYASGMLPTSHGHTLYWEQSGNPDGVPAVFLHGGPGAGAAPVHRRFFDPTFYRIVVFDQRGAGRSTPLGDVSANTTQDLIADIEKLRVMLEIDRWLVFGGSWGSTLALAYAVSHPERCLGFVLRGIFLGQDSEVEWFLQGMRNIFPEAWAEFIEHLPAEERHDPLPFYYKRLTDPDPKIHMPAARVWSRYEAACSTLHPNPRAVLEVDGGNFALALARIEAHYFINRCFLPEGWFANFIDRIRHLPCTIVQGRYDIVCPPITAEALAKSWPGVDYIVVPDAGHSALEPGVRAALVNATERFRMTWRGIDPIGAQFPWQH